MKKPLSSKIGGAFKNWNTFLVVLLVLEFVVFGLANEKFLRIPLLLNSINDFIAICLISLFVTFVMITGGIDIQAGSIVGLTSIVIGVFWQDFGLNIWGAVLLAVAIAAVCGALSGFFVAYCGVQAMVVTLGGQFLYAGLALLVSTLSSTESYQGISGFPESFKALTGFKLFGVIPSQVLIFLAMTVIAWLLLHKSKYGRKVFLVGVNPQAAEYSGINTRRVILSTYVLSAVSAAVAGIVLTSYLGTAKSDLGSTLTMNIITACVLGGTLSTGGKGSAIGQIIKNIDPRFFKVFSMPSTPTEEEKSLKMVAEGAIIPETRVSAQENLVKLHKRGRMLVASYEAIQFQRLDLFSVTLRQIGAYINRMHVADAIDVICNGDGNKNGADRYTVGTKPIAGTAGTLSYDALVDFWSQFAPYTMNTLLVGDAMAQILKLEEMQDSTAGLAFQGTGKLVTPMGATLLRSSAVPSGTIIGLDRQYALELVRGSEVLVEYDKLIDRQLERAAITSISGFAKVFQPASKVLQIGTAGEEG